MNDASVSIFGRQLETDQRDKHFHPPQSDTQSKLLYWSTINRTRKGQLTSQLLLHLFVIEKYPQDFLCVYYEMANRDDWALFPLRVDWERDPHCVVFANSEKTKTCRGDRRESKRERTSNRQLVLQRHSGDLINSISLYFTIYFSYCYGDMEMLIESARSDLPRVVSLARPAHRVIDHKMSFWHWQPTPAWRTRRRFWLINLLLQ